MTDPPSEHHLLYERRRVDQLTDARWERIETQLDDSNKKLDRLESRINYLFGGLALFVGLVNLAVPLVVHYLTGSP